MMKNRFRFYLIIAFILTLVLSSGAYAYAYSTATETINIAEPTGDIATCNETAAQPDWDSVLTPENDTIIYRPDAAGDETNIANQLPASGEHWDKVSEETPDGDSTVVYTDNASWEEDLYNIDDHSTQTAGGTINYVTVYMVSRSTANATQTNAYIHVKTHDTEYNGSGETTTTSYASYSAGTATNPFTGEAWTWDEIDALQIGVGHRRPTAGGELSGTTQVYAEVDFDAPPLSGSTPTGDLFIVTPNGDYTGDLSVKVYLLNTDNLTKAYQQLNMELYLEGSVEAGQTPNYRVLNIQTGMATFKIEGGGSDNHTLSVTGGDYTLTSREISEWEAGWTVTPELYCEVTQR